MKKMMFAALVSIVTLPAFAASIDGEYEYRNKPNPNDALKHAPSPYCYQ